MDITNIDTRRLIDNMPCGIVVHAADSTVLYANPMALKILRMSRGQAEGKDALDEQWRFIDEKGVPIVPEQYPVSRVLTDGAPVKDMVIGIVDSSSRDVTWVRINAYAEMENGALKEVVVMFYDITEEKNAIPFKDIVTLTSDAVIVTEAAPLRDPGPRIVYVNSAFTDISGYTPEEVLGKSPRILQGENTAEDAKKRMRKAFESGTPVREIVLNYDKAGKEYWLDLNIYPLYDPFGNINYFAAIERDVTELKLQEEELRMQATQDALTSLLNRRGFMEHGRFALAQARRMDWPISIVMLDIDHFKRINDTHGHDVGDEALRMLGALLREETRQSDIVGRLGGEEFALILPNTFAHAAMGVAEKLRSVVKRLLVPTGGGNLSFTVSLGIAGKSDAPDSLDELLKQADAALYAAKNGGRDQTRTFQQGEMK